MIRGIITNKSCNFSNLQMVVLPLDSWSSLWHYQVRKVRAKVLMIKINHWANIGFSITVSRLYSNEIGTAMAFYYHVSILIPIELAYITPQTRVYLKLISKLRFHININFTKWQLAWDLCCTADIGGSGEKIKGKKRNPKWSVRGRDVELRRSQNDQLGKGMVDREDSEVTSVRIG